MNMLEWNVNLLNHMPIPLTVKKWRGVTVMFWCGNISRYWHDLRSSTLFTD